MTTSIPKEPNDKCCLILDLAYHEYTLLRDSGVRIRGGLLVEHHEAIGWVMLPKQSLVMEMILSDPGFHLKPSEIERELFPAVVAYFHRDEETHVHD